MSKPAKLIECVSKNNPWIGYVKAVDDRNRAREVWYTVRRTICKYGEQPHFLAAETRTWATLAATPRARR